MKRIFLSACLVASVFYCPAQVPGDTSRIPIDSFYALTPVEVRAVRAGENAPFTKTNLSRQSIAKNNLGQDIPFLLDQTPSVVVNSDAGNGFGYTGIRIRGTDATRINVTLNGIPYNDAESQGTFFVDLPDFSSSTGSIQVQRGVGTSSNGAGAFGASINLSSNELNTLPYVELSNSAGSFNSWKHTIKAGTGVMNGFSTDFRLSRLNSDGFIDRATSDLQSFYFSSAYTAKKTQVRINIFSGKEKTYQAWNGISEADIRAGNRQLNSAGTEKPGDPYPNEIDDYTQTHYQLFLQHYPGKKIRFNTALFLTRGKGFYEQYKSNEDYSDYHLPPSTSNTGFNYTTDLVRQLWLDNYFYGNIFSFQYNHARTEATLGGGYTRYDGRHFGKVIWAEKGLTSLNNWYDLDALKTDATIYYKQQTGFSANWTGYYDLQLRHVKYTTDGFRNNPELPVKVSYIFFNPKLGITYLRNKWKAYASFSVANKEPNRDDFEAGKLQYPSPERLYDAELGVTKTNRNNTWSATFFYMHYKDQLVLTGQINDVGAYTRTNIPTSYRTGLELQGTYLFSKQFNVAGNFSASMNKIRDFSEYIDDYDNGGQLVNKYHSTDIALSPAITGAATLNYLPIKYLELSLLNKYVSRQYLDNTSMQSRSLDPFFVQDLRLNYSLKIKSNWLKQIDVLAKINNLWNNEYEPNGYTFSYFAGGSTVTENFYFPMAGRNFLAGISLVWK